jgi:hypothetical protein
MSLIDLALAVAVILLIGCVHEIFESFRKRKPEAAAPPSEKP